MIIVTHNASLKQVMRNCDQGDGRDPGFRRQGNVDQVAGAGFDDVLITLIVVIITIIVIVITFIAIAQIIKSHQVVDACWKLELHYALLS